MGLGKVHKADLDRARIKARVLLEDSDRSREHLVLDCKLSRTSSSNKAALEDSALLAPKANSSKHLLVDQLSEAGLLWLEILLEPVGNNKLLLNRIFSLSVLSNLRQAPQITPITRLSDLPTDAQKLFEDLEKYITEQKSICEDLKTRSPQIDEYVLSIPADVAEVQKRFDTIFHILSVDTATLNNDLKVKVPQIFIVRR